MKITVKINTDTLAGKRLENELRRYPESVEFIESTVVADAAPTVYVSVKENFEPVGEPINSISATESAKLAFSRLGEKYNCTFDNKYTR
jgi:hypothetical protein